MLFECSSHPGAVSQTNRIQVAGFHFFSVVGSSHLTAALGKFCYISLGWLTNLYMHKNSFLRRRFVRFDNQLVFFVWKTSHKKSKRPKPWKAWKTLRNRNKSWKCSTTPWAWHVVPGLQKIDGHGLLVNLIHVVQLHLFMWGVVGWYPPLESSRCSISICQLPPPLHFSLS